MLANRRLLEGRPTSILFMLWRTESRQELPRGCAGVSETETASGKPWTRNATARGIAGLIALLGTQFAALVAALGVESVGRGAFFRWLLLFGGWLFPYFALIWAAAGKRLPGDPFTTWVPCILANGLWLAVSVADGTISIGAIYAVWAACSAVFALALELRHNPKPAANLPPR
jgi:hypothetical protein